MRSPREFRRFRTDWRSRRAAVSIALGLALLACDRAAPAATDPSVAITPIPIDEGATLERASGARSALGGGPVLLHFWATWCAPCRRELPALIEAARASDARVLAISLDPAWPPVRAFFDGEAPPEVARDPSGELARALGVSSLPDSYLVDSEGRAVRRIAGALDWSAAAHRRWLAHATRRSEE